MNVTSRFIKVIDLLVANRIVQSVVELSKSVPSLYPQKIQNMRTHKNNVTAIILEDFCAAFPQVNGDYILTGRNEPFLDSSIEIPQSIRPDIANGAEMIKMFMEMQRNIAAKDAKIIELTNIIKDFVERQIEKQEQAN